MPPELEAGDLARATRDALGPQGALAQADPQFVERDVQQQLAAAVADAVDTHATLVAEAGTGVGKTFAYLVPLLLSGRRALVSTATKSLQDQLFLRDLPRLRDALRVPVRIALLKGRGSYLCLHRLQQARETGTLPDRFAVRALARIETWAPGTRTGDLAEIDGLDERSPVIPLVTSTRDNCLGQECPEFINCHVVKARREAMAADLVVVNHHLFFADLSLRDSGVAELLPTVDAAVFDEAHQLVETGLQFLGMVPSKVDARNPRHVRHQVELQAAYPKLMAPASIGLRSSIADALASGVPVWKIRKTAARKATHEVRALAAYVFEKMEIAQ